MKTSAVTQADLGRSVISVPPLARTPDFELDPVANRRLLQHLSAGGVSTVLYGGNANLYNITHAQYGQLLAELVDWAPDDMWVIPSIGPSFGQMLDHADLVREYDYPTAMILPLTTPATPVGAAKGVRQAAERLGQPIILYLKWESYLTTDLVAELVNDGIVCAIKYAIVREDPSKDDYLTDLLQKVPTSLVISGIGERPAVTHWRDFGLTAFTSGSACVAPKQSTLLLKLLKDGDLVEAEAVRQRFLPLEDLRDGIHPVRTLHEAVTEAGIASMGPHLPLLSALAGADVERVGEAARQLLLTE